MRKLMKKKNSGITLIALVVTIIILLILAGISIQMISGDNGILKRAGEARERYKDSEEMEKISMAVLSSIEADSDIPFTINEKIFRDEIANIGGKVNKLETKYKIEFENENKVYYVYSDGKVRMKEENELDINDIRSKASTYFSCDILNYTPALQSLRIYRVAIALCRENWGNK